jgi:glycosyltransferase involved in cell wall biosynthesis
MGKEAIAPEVRVGESSSSSNGFSPHIYVRPLRISVIICAYSLDRWDALVAAVQSCFGQTLRPAEVVVVIDHNDDLLGRATVEFPDGLVIPNRGTKGLSGARNTGVAATTGDVIAFLDDDSFAEPDWLEQLTGPLTDPRIAGVGGWIQPKWEDGPARWLPESYYWVIGCSYAGLPSSQERLRNPIGANMALRRDIFTSVGGFTSGIGRIGKVPLGCEETELCIRYSAHFPDRHFIMVREAVVSRGTTSGPVAGPRGSRRPPCPHSMGARRVFPPRGGTSSAHCRGSSFIVCACCPVIRVRQQGGRR